MTTATPPTTTTRTTSGTDRRDATPSARPSIPSGWYDPDGAAWEGEPTPVFESFRATPVRPAIRVERVDERDR